MKKKIKKLMKNKKLITILMEYIITIECFIMLFLLLSPNPTKAATSQINGTTWRYTVVNQKAVNVYCEEGAGKEVVIPEKLGGYPVVNIYNPHGSGRNIFASTDNETNATVEKVIIPEGVEEIGDYAFYYCTNLKEIEIATTVAKIGENAYISENAVKYRVKRMLQSINIESKSEFCDIMRKYCMNIAEKHGI